MEQKLYEVHVERDQWHDILYILVAANEGDAFQMYRTEMLKHNWEGTPDPESVIKQHWDEAEIIVHNLAPGCKMDFYLGV